MSEVVCWIDSTLDFSTIVTLSVFLSTTETTWVNCSYDLNTTFSSIFSSYSLVTTETISVFFNSLCCETIASWTFRIVLSTLITLMSVVDVVFIPVTSLTTTVVWLGWVTFCVTTSVFLSITLTYFVVLSTVTLTTSDPFSVSTVTW